MKALIDQVDDTEFPVFPAALIRDFRANFRKKNGRDPESKETANDDQLMALHFRVESGGSLYADFGVWTPFQERVGYLQKFTTFRATGAGTFEQVEIKGPNGFLAWQMCWR